MCYSMRCKYQTWGGECRIGGSRFPADAACMEDFVDDEDDREDDEEGEDTWKSPQILWT